MRDFEVLKIAHDKV